MELEHEIQRLRDWRHETDKTLWAIGIQLTQVRGEVSAIAPEVDRLIDSEKIATEVAKRLRTQNTLRLSHWQRLGAFVVGAAAIADTISRFVH